MVKVQKLTFSVTLQRFVVGIPKFSREQWFVYINRSVDKNSQKDMLLFWNVEEKYFFLDNSRRETVTIKNVYYTDIKCVSKFIHWRKMCSCPCAKGKSQVLHKYIKNVSTHIYLCSCTLFKSIRHSKYIFLLKMNFAWSLSRHNMFTWGSA